MEMDRIIIDLIPESLRDSLLQSAFRTESTFKCTDKVLGRSVSAD